MEAFFVRVVLTLIAAVVGGSMMAVLFVVVRKLQMLLGMKDHHAIEQPRPASVR